MATLTQADLLAVLDLVEHANRALASQGDEEALVLVTDPTGRDDYAQCTLTSDNDQIQADLLLFEGRLYMQDDLGPIPVRPFVTEHVSSTELRLGWAVCDDSFWIDDTPPKTLPRPLIPRRRGH